MRVAYEKTVSFHLDQEVTIRAVADGPYAILDLNVIDSSGEEVSISLGGREAGDLRVQLTEALSQLERASADEHSDAVKDFYVGK